MLDKKIKSFEKIKNEYNKNSLDFINNLNSLKNRINKNDFNSINDWDYYKKKDLSKNLIKGKKILKKNYILNFDNYLINDLIINSVFFLKYKKFNNMFYLNNNLFSKFLIDIYININSKKINLYKNENFYKIQSIIVIILDIRKLKSKITVMNKNKCLCCLNNGLMFKKLKLRNKKYKKLEKLTFLIIKDIITRMGGFKSYNNIIINIKGLRKNLNDIISHFKKKLEIKNIIFINNENISKNKKFSFKKIKAIKRKLKKSLIKYK